MRNKFNPTLLYRVAMLAAAVVFTGKAAAPEPMHWKDLTSYLRGKLVTIITKDGKSVSGHLAVVRPEGIYFNDPASANVPREAVLSLHWQTPYESQTRKLGKMLSTGYRHAGRLLGTPMGPFGLVELPAITAFGAASTPFCLLGDVFARSVRPSGDISILPDAPAEVRK